MADEYKVRSTSNVSAAVADRELSSSTTTRRILRPELLDNPKNTDACVKISIVHQRKKPKDGWEDIEQPATTYGQSVNFNLTLVYMREIIETVF